MEQKKYQIHLRSIEGQTVSAKVGKGFQLSCYHNSIPMIYFVMNSTSLIQRTCGHDCCKQGVISKAKRKRPVVSLGSFLSSVVFDYYAWVS